jgi:hypothetical protein
MVFCDPPMGSAASPDHSGNGKQCNPPEIPPKKPGADYDVEFLFFGHSVASLISAQTSRSISAASSQSLSVVPSGPQSTLAQSTATTAHLHGTLKYDSIWHLVQLFPNPLGITGHAPYSN